MSYLETIVLPVTGKFNGHTLWLAFLPDHHLIEVPTAASTTAVMTHTDPAHLAQGYGLNEKLIVLREEKETAM